MYVFSRNQYNIQQFHLLKPPLYFSPSVKVFQTIVYDLIIKAEIKIKDCFLWTKTFLANSCTNWLFRLIMANRNKIGSKNDYISLNYKTLTTRMIKIGYCF